VLLSPQAPWSLLGAQISIGEEGEGSRGVGGSDPLVFAHPFEPENRVGSIRLAAAARTHSHRSLSFVCVGGGGGRGDLRGRRRRRRRGGGPSS
jgi:hypothetical protein